ncbi:MAG: SH3 domain-containing protein [Leptolyngbyaceae cyanobacterium]
MEVSSSQSVTTEIESTEPSESLGTELEVEASPEEEAPLLSQEMVLVAKDPDTQINIRSNPGTEAVVVGTGFVGDEVTASRLFQAEDGYSWYYVQFNGEAGVGWVREDFVEVLGLAPIAQADDGADVLSPALDNHCGGLDGIEIYYRTARFITYICRSGDRSIYISNEIGTSQVLVTEDVKSLPTDNFGYIAHHDNYEYHISETELAVYRTDDRGDLTRVLQERVTIAEQY